jgi:hypothetical protein
MRSEAPLRCHGTLRRNPPHGIQHPIRRIHTIQILSHFRTQESARHRMIWIALDFGGAAIFHRDQHSASIGAIMRTRGMDNFLHDSYDYTVPSEG